MKRLWTCLFFCPIAIGQIFDRAAIDKTVNPCEDFYQYSCGHWLETHPVPADQPMVARYSDLRERNQRLVREAVEQAARDRAATGSQRQL